MERRENVTLAELQLYANYLCPVFVNRAGQKIAVGDVYRCYNQIGPDEWYVWDYTTGLVTQLGGY